MYFMFFILRFLRILCDIVCVNHCLWLCFAATQPAAPGDNRVLLAWLLSHTHTHTHTQTDSKAHSHKSFKAQDFLEKHWKLKKKEKKPSSTWVRFVRWEKKWLNFWYIMNVIPSVSPHGLDMAGEKQKTQGPPQGFGLNRSEERRVGKECLRLCRSRWSPDH